MEIQQKINQHVEFDLQLAAQCASAFNTATGLGCHVADSLGNIYVEYGFTCAKCGICRLMGRDAKDCIESGIYGMRSADRFGGKYVYFCPAGLTCFVSPISGPEGIAAKITVGPFLMVDREDFCEFELRELMKFDENQCDRIKEVLVDVPYVAPEKVDALSTLLFLAVGFMNDVSRANRMLETQQIDDMQGQIAQYIQKIKGGEDQPVYPFVLERELLHSIEIADLDKSKEQLNELLGHIFFASGGRLEVIKSRIYELLVLISRAAINGGADTERSFQLSHTYLQQIQTIDSIDALCFWLSSVMDSFMGSAFEYRHVKNMDVIRKAVTYLQHHYTEKVTLEDVAQYVYLSPAYFSKVFKEEMGCNFNIYLNRLRIDKSKMLLGDRSMKMVQISTLLGFEDQSYFTKVFKKLEGISPKDFRKQDKRTRI